MQVYNYAWERDYNKIVLIKKILGYRNTLITLFNNYEARGEVALQSLLASISGRLETLIFQWATIEAREWLHLSLFRT